MFETRLAGAAAQVAARLTRALGAVPPGAISEAMAWALDGGKGLRGYLVLESAALHGVTEAEAIHAAAAIEAMHAYSLVHDDLPCMDDDDLRRGKPTIHRKWDEATAVLTGDALQALAFDLVAQGNAPADRRLALSQALARAAGAGGMVHGQALDIAAETAPEPLDLAAITRLQAAKTGALIEWSCTAGPILAGADPAPLAAYARAIGLAFQIADDLLDVEGDPGKTGKALRKDEAAGKATFVSLLGLAGARDRAAELIDEAIAALTPHGPAAEPLAACARYILTRDR